MEQIESPEINKAYTNIWKGAKNIQRRKDISSINVAEEPGYSHVCKRIKLGPCITLITKINHNGVKTYIRSEIMNLLGENLRKKLLDLGLRNILDMAPKAQATK